MDFLKAERRGLIIAFLATLLLGIAIAIKLSNEGFLGFPLFGGVSSLALFGFIYFVAMLTQAQKFIGDITQKKPAIIFVLPTVLSLIYLWYSFSTEAIQWDYVLRIIGYTFLPTIAIFTVNQETQRLTWQDFLFLIIIWIPVDEAWVQESFPWPAGIGKHAYTIPVGVTLAILLSGGFRRLKGLDFHWNVGAKSWGISVLHLLAFLAFAIPVGLATDFLAYNPRDGGISGWVVSIIATAILVAVPEEVLFRGIIQNLLQKTFQKPWIGWVLASVIFGVSHINNTPSPDWRYIFLASIAGLFYGLSYNKSGSLIPAVMVHTGVDVVWINLFYK